MPVINGTAGNDTLLGTTGNDEINGLGGDDVITSSNGGIDTINGGAGRDRINLSFGNFGGSAIVDGGDDDDWIRLSALNGHMVSASGGNGNDVFEYQNQAPTFSDSVSLDGGAGSDLFVLYEMGAGSAPITITTGTGVDTIRFQRGGDGSLSLQAIVTDFTAGAGGDRIDFGDYLGMLTGWVPDSNPFGSSHMLLAQQGAHTVLFVDRDGIGPNSALHTLITFRNTTVASLTAYNFFGWNPNGSAPVGQTIDGDGGDNVLTGEAGADTIHGLGGNDSIDGKDGSDVVHGDEGDDTLSDYEGANGEMYGGDGDDHLIFARNGTDILSATIDGGGDDDLIEVANADDSVTVLGGAGNDRLRLQGPGDSPIVDLGTGNDTLIVGVGTHYATLGADSDRIVYEAFGTAIIADFQAGAGGDVIDVGSALLLGASGWDYHTNPFDTGHVALSQHGGGVVVRLDLNGAGGSALLRDIAVLQNVTIAQLTGDNFGGWNPNGGQTPGQVIVGTAGPDTLNGTDLADTITGLGDDDVLRGGLSNDSLDGGEGNDDLDGGHADDTVVGGLGNDVIVDSFDGDDSLSGGDGNDVITVTRPQNRFVHGPSDLVIDGGADNDTISIIGSGLQNGEHINADIDAGTGNDLVQVAALNGGTIDLGDGDDRLELNAFAQTLNATITLGAGVDTVSYRRPAVPPGTKTITDFEAGEGGDRLEFLPGWNAISFIQDGANVRVIETTGGDARTILYLLNVQASALIYYNTGVPQNGSSGPDQIFGSPSADVINGLGGSDFLNGLGGNDQLNGGAGDDTINGGGGADLMDGGTGNDIYYVDNPGDQVVEASGGGNDAVYSSVTYVLAANQSVELLSTSSHGATTPINLTGNNLAQTIVGNAGANVLNGLGGNDSMQGLGGDDVYHVDSTDAVFEAAGQGNDVVYASASHALLANQSVEILSTVSHGATTAINLTGNNLTNTIIGNAGANALNGGGGTDYLQGLGGNDIYYVDTAADQVSEVAGQGADTVYASASYILRAGHSVETLSTVSHGAATAIDLTGNETAQTLIGNAGVNRLDGKGGNDSLVGLGGADTFAFTTALGAGNVDTISGFQTGVDKIALDDAVFAGIGGPGPLDPNAFRTGAAAQDDTDRIVYDSATGLLFFDSDGSGSNGAILFTRLDPGLVLTAGDFTVI